MAEAVVLGTAHPHVMGLAAEAKKTPGISLKGVYDDDANRLKAASEKLGVPAFASLDVALSHRPALALIGAVPADRASLAMEAVRVGASVLVDKPVAVTRKALDDLVAAVERSGRQVIMYFPYRGNPMMRAAKAALDSGKIGRLVRVMSCGPHKLNAATRPAWHWTREHNGGALIDIGSHHADLCCWMAGQSPVWISALHVNLSQPAHPEFQDFAQAQMRFPGGELAHLEVDWLNPSSMKHFGDTRLWLQGTTGKIEVRLGDEISGLMWTSDKAATPLDDKTQPSGEHWAPTLMTELATGKPCSIPQADVWRAAKVTLAMFESACAGGKPVTNV